MTAATDIRSWLRAQEEKDLLRFVAIGSVDDGKSTLIGRLLHDAHGLYEDQLLAAKHASRRGATRGAGSTSEIDFSLFTDGLQAEREQGITIDVAYRYFATERRKFIIADTPGHVQYTRNMATGASTADAALILVDARLGVLAQTRRHAQIAALLGIEHVIACVNKMDLVNFDQKIFEAIRDELQAVGRKLALPAEIHALPVSALAGDNVVTPSSNMPWFQGAPLLELLETLTVDDRRKNAPFRLPVQLVLRPGIGYRGFAGQIVSGTVRRGDEVLTLPSGKKTRVVAVDVAGKEVESAIAPASVALRLADEIDVTRGDMIATAIEPPQAVTEFQADLVWMSERPLDRQRPYLLKHTTRSARAQIDTIVHGTDPETLTPVATSAMGLNDIARVRVRCHAPLFVDRYASIRATGAFILIDTITNDTVAAGMIASVDATSSAGASQHSSQVSAEERRTRLDQAGAVLRVHAPELDLALSAAYALERELFDRGRIATVITHATVPAETAEACARAGLIAIVPLEGPRLSVQIDDRPAEPRAAADLVRLTLEALESADLFGAG